MSPNDSRDHMKSLDRAGLSRTQGSASLSLRVCSRASAQASDVSDLTLMGTAPSFLVESAFDRVVSHEQTAREYSGDCGDENSLVVTLSVEGESGIAFDQNFMGIDSASKLEVRVDTHEPNACGFGPEVPWEYLV